MYLKRKIDIKGAPSSSGVEEGVKRRCNEEEVVEETCTCMAFRVVVVTCIPVEEDTCAKKIHHNHLI